MPKQKIEEQSTPEKVTIHEGNHKPELKNVEKLEISPLQSTSGNQEVPTGGPNTMHETIDRFYKRYDRVKETDWHRCRKYRRSQMMQLLLIGSEMIQSKGVTVADFRKELLKYPCHFLQIAGSFQELREPLRNMRNKYKKEQDHIAFSAFLKEAESMYEHFKTELCDDV